MWPWKKNTEIDACDMDNCEEVKKLAKTIKALEVSHAEELEKQIEVAQREHYNLRNENWDLRNKVSLSEHRYDTLQQINAALQYTDSFLNGERQWFAQFTSDKHGVKVQPEDLAFYAWPQITDNKTAEGINSLVCYSIYCFHNTIHDDCILILAGKKQYHEIFKPFMQYNTINMQVDADDKN